MIFYKSEEVKTPRFVVIEESNVGETYMWVDADGDMVFSINVGVPGIYVDQTQAVDIIKVLQHYVKTGKLLKEKHLDTSTAN